VNLATQRTGIILGNGKKLPDLTGERFGRLGVLRYAGIVNERSAWEVECQCGVRKIVSDRHLKEGTKSCGCLNREIVRIRMSHPEGEAARREVWMRYKRGAQERGLSWDLSFPDFRTLVTDNCHYCGALPSNRMGDGYNGDFLYNGIDRKKNGEGYTQNNVVSSCRRCNFAKHTMDYEEFVSYLILAGQRMERMRQ
jgi:hypothetical protein